MKLLLSLISVQLKSSHILFFDCLFAIFFIQICLLFLSSNLIWKQDNGEGLCLEYPHIELHAISSDLNAFPYECLYVMMDSNILGMHFSDFIFKKIV